MQKVDSIVSPCENIHLRHNKGVAKEIARYAGPRIMEISNEFVAKEERFGILRNHAYETKPGMINCKTLIHSILPEFAKSR